MYVDTGGPGTGSSGGITHPHPRAGECGVKTRLPHKSYSSAFSNFTRTISPGLTLVSPFNTAPSISGAHPPRYLGAAPSSSTSSSTITRISRPTFPASAHSGDLLLQLHKVGSSCPSSPFRHPIRQLIRAPALHRLYLKRCLHDRGAPRESRASYLEVFFRFAGEADTIKVERRVSSGQISRHCLPRASCGQRNRRFISLNPRLACCSGMSR